MTTVQQFTPDGPATELFTSFEQALRYAKELATSGGFNLGILITIAPDGPIEPLTGFEHLEFE